MEGGAALLCTAWCGMSWQRQLVRELWEEEEGIAIFVVMSNTVS